MTLAFSASKPFGLLLISLFERSGSLDASALMHAPGSSGTSDLSISYIAIFYEAS